MVNGTILLFCELLEFRKFLAEILAIDSHSFNCSIETEIEPKTTEAFERSHNK